MGSLDSIFNRPDTDDSYSTAVQTVFHTQVTGESGDLVRVRASGAVDQKVNVVAATGATEVLEFGKVYDLTMDQNCSFTFSGGAESGYMARCVAIIRGAFTVTLTGVIWLGGTIPTYATPTLYEFFTLDGGTTVIGQALTGLDV